MEDWKDARDRNKAKRVTWKPYLGCSLSKFTAAMVAEKKAQSSIEKAARIQAEMNGALRDMSPERLAELIHFGVGARVAEMSTEKTALKARLSENCSWRARVRQFANGRGYIFIADGVDLKDGDFVELRGIKLEETGTERGLLAWQVHPDKGVGEEETNKVPEAGKVQENLQEGDVGKEDDKKDGHERGGEAVHGDVESPAKQTCIDIK